MTDLSKEALDALVKTLQIIAEDTDDEATPDGPFYRSVAETIEALRRERETAQLSAKQWEEEAHRRAINERDARTVTREQWDEVWASLWFYRCDEITKEAALNRIRKALGLTIQDSAPKRECDCPQALLNDKGAGLCQGKHR